MHQIHTQMCVCVCVREREREERVRAWNKVRARTYASRTKTKGCLAAAGASAILRERPKRSNLHRSGISTVVNHAVLLQERRQPLGYPKLFQFRSSHAIEFFRGAFCPDGLRAP